MNQNSVKWFGYLLFFAFLIVACAQTGTEISQKQIDKEYKGKPVSDILVIAITGIERNRRLFEERFVAQLKSVGVDAISSEKAIPMPADLKLKKEDILKAVKQYENDAVIITHLIGREEKEVYTRGDSVDRGIYGFYHSRSNHPGYSAESTTVRLQTNLYEVKTEKLIWSAKSKTWSPDSTDRIINDVIKALINNLQNNKIIAPK